MYYSSYGFRPYVPVAQRRAKALAYAKKAADKAKRALAPVVAARQIATSFWGKAWCQHLEKYSDFANRLPRGRTYVRNGSVIDLQIERGKIQAIVAGSEVYKIRIDIKTLAKSRWSKVKAECARSIASLMDLLQGRLDEATMKRLTRPKDGMFPEPNEISMHCSCPDWAGLCKHLAAVLYGVGARLDTEPELLFTLRDVDHQELITAAVGEDNLDRSLKGQVAATLRDSDLGDIFGIELDGNRGVKAPALNEVAPASLSQGPARLKTSRARRKPTIKDAVKKGSRKSRTLK